jgi:hypothetical protein
LRGVLLLVSALWVAGTAEAQSARPLPRTEIQLPAQALVGAWKLVSIQYAFPQGPAVDDLFDPNPARLIICDRSGWVSVQIVTSNRPRMEQPDSRTNGVVTTEQAQLNTTAFNSYYAYFGRWELDDQTGTVTHRLEASLLPWETGLVLPRQAMLDGDRLTLLAHYTRRGVDYIRTLVWKRL